MATKVNPYPPPLMPGESQRNLNGVVFSEVYARAYFDGASLERICPTSLRWVDDPFTDATMGRFTNLTTDTLGVFAIAGGQGSIQQAAGAAHSNHIYEGAAVAPCSQVMVTLDMVTRVGVIGGSEAFRLGIFKDVNNYVEVRLDVIANTCSIQVKVGGASAFLGSVAAAWLTTFPYTLAFSVVGNSACVYRYYNGAWSYITGADLTSGVPALDFKAEALATWFGCFGLVSDGAQAKTWTFDNFRVGRFGGTAARDWCVVTSEDGTPNVTAGVVKTLGTIVDPRGVGCMGLFDFDLNKKTATQRSLIMVSRGGKVQNDLAGHLILYPNGDQLLSISTWGSGSVAVRILQKLELAATQDITTGSKVVAGMTQLNLTVLPAGGSQWDPMMVLRAGTWYMAYTASGVAAYSFYPALDTSADRAVWANVGSDPAALRYEGTRILFLNGTPHVVTGGQFDMKYWSLATFTYEGIINLKSPGDGTTQPHAMIFPDVTSGLYWCLTFDQQTWPAASGVNFAWGWVRLFASPLY